MLGMQMELYDCIYPLIDEDARKGLLPTFFTLGKDFTRLRKHTPWLQELPFAVVRYTLKYQADAWTAFFKGQRGRPKFKGKRGDDSFTIPSNVTIRRNRLYIPKLGWYVLRRRGANPYEDAEPKRATVKQVQRKWYCTVSYQVDLPERTDDGTVIGVDRNVSQIATSDGETIHLPDTKRLEARRRRYQRRMARQRKGSNRRNRTKRLIAKTCRKIAQGKRDWCHQTSRTLANNASTVVLEDLKTSQMTRSAKGTVDEPGRNVRQKAGLNRGILASGWGQLEQMLTYKAFKVEKVNPMYTSQTCSACGYINKKNRPSQAEFTCQACGHHDNADVNAALNILALGLGAAARGEAFSLETSVSREKMHREARYGSSGI